MKYEKVNGRQGDSRPYVLASGLPRYSDCDNAPDCPGNVMKAVIVIPARLESTRLPRKLLLNETGKPLIQHTWEQAKKTGLDVIVATDSYDIVRHILDSNGLSCHTMPCRNGTERVAQIAKAVEADIYVNWQADEPEIDPSAIHGLVDSVCDDDWPSIASLMWRTEDKRDIRDVNNTKVVLDDRSQAIYFSRSPVPHGLQEAFIHIGVYAYSRSILQSICRLKPVRIEAIERLEQLRWLCAGYGITMLETTRTHGINTREDYDAFVERQKVIA